MVATLWLQAAGFASANNHVRVHSVDDYFAVQVVAGQLRYSSYHRSMVIEQFASTPTSGQKGRR